MLHTIWDVNSLGLESVLKENWMPCPCSHNNNSGAMQILPIFTFTDFVDSDFQGGNKPVEIGWGWI